MTNRTIHAKTKRDERYLDPDLVRDLQNRLHCLEGHIRGIARMLDGQAACEDLLIQTSAVRAALNQINIKIIEGLTLEYILESVKDDEKPIAFDQLRSALAQALRSA